MTTKYNIGTLNEATLATGTPNLGFQVVNGGNNLPYWLPAGTLVGFYIASVGKVSIIEFNVIP